MVERTEMVERIQMALTRLEDFDNAYSMDFDIWRTRTIELLKRAFGDDWHQEKFSKVIWHYSPHWRNGETKERIAEIRQMRFESAKRDSQIILSESIEDLKYAEVDSSAFYKLSGIDDKKNVVFITHGRNEEWKDVQRFIENSLKISTLELAQTVSGGRTIIEKLEEEAEKCNYAVIVMSADDLDADGNAHVRENVMHEIGFFQAKYGRNRVCLLHCESVTIPTNIAGIVYLGYPSKYIKATFVDLGEEIKHALGL